MNSVSNAFRVATYNIHKGVQGIGPARRLEIHNLGHAIEQLDADIVCLQEVRKMNSLAATQFSRWPDLPQADFLAPEGYTAVYETNAITRHGEHGNALLTRWPVLRTSHRDISDHRFEQRGLLHVAIDVDGHTVHTIVVHLGLIRGSRKRQIIQLGNFIEREIPPDEAVIVAGDFNDWGARMRYSMNAMGLRDSSDLRGPRTLTFPSRMPVAQLDFIYGRRLDPVSCTVPRGPIWARMSDHLPLVTDFVLSKQ
ncbi:MAG: endonuclease/exonuclease/phosphatase family protein [Gammaproteobacteria bacterium]|nr:endonuclease/exonuclease/phosphatase family protein [Gammaproteobacteria bacterium]MBU1440491.1 endonuclease/exonuclease/phosphatase family protein [Gammaproteobacteria bacterium]MBU2286589.1 endonuclease/exonuclease/phosphatase family protein [Gammaproteobacteria bacterium]MBU2410312.1 endonuclease/exonuclease/phosphatase family protein [Gammaproteobacteria bacterium]